MTERSQRENIVLLSEHYHTLLHRLEVDSDRQTAKAYKYAMKLLHEFAHDVIEMYGESK